MPDLETLIHEIRGQKVMIDSDLARIYGVATKALNQAVKRNRDKFPADFMFRLTAKEARGIQRSRSQFVTLKRGQNIKYLPSAFTEHGAIMAANVLNSPRAVQMNTTCGDAVGWTALVAWGCDRASRESASQRIRGASILENACVAWRQA